MNRLAGFVFLQIALGNVGSRARFMYQHVVPRLVFGRPGFGILRIPLVRPRKLGINVKDDAAVIEQPVVDGLSNRKRGGSFF